MSEARPVVAEALVQRIFTHGTKPGANRIEEAIKLGLILFLVKASAGLADLMSFRVTCRLKNIPRFQQQLARVSVN